MADFERKLTDTPIEVVVSPVLDTQIPGDLESPPETPQPANPNIPPCTSEMSFDLIFRPVDFPTLERIYERFRSEEESLAAAIAKLRARRFARSFLGRLAALLSRFRKRQ